MKRLYDWLHRWYCVVEHVLDPALERVLRSKIATLGDTATMTALDYACGSGMWTLKIAPHFRSVVGRDQSSGMLARARRRARRAGLAVTFREGNILHVDDEDGSADWVFVAYALHLFPLETELSILRSLLRVARRGVMIVDHSRTWNLGNAIVEWLEGSHYEQFIRTDFASLGREVGAFAFEEEEIGDCMVLTFRKV